MNSTPLRSPRLFFAIFTLSGFSGLIYESIWSHYLKLFLGHAAYAQTLVLAIFMGGMALGSWLIAKYSHRVTNLLLGYAIVEGVIGLMGLIFHGTSIGVTSWVFESLLPNVDSVAAGQLLKWSLGALLILPQSILLGMTFPLMSGAAVRRFPNRSGETLAMLYFTNSLGAALGVLIERLRVDRRRRPAGHDSHRGPDERASGASRLGHREVPGRIPCSRPRLRSGRRTGPPRPTIVRWMLIERIRHRHRLVPLRDRVDQDAEPRVRGARRIPSR